MKAQLKFLKDFFSPLHKKTLTAGASIEIDVDTDGVPIHSFWFDQLKTKRNASYFELVAASEKASPDKNIKSK